MRQSNGYWHPIIAWLSLSLCWGCAGSPLEVTRAGSEIDFQRYTTLAVRDFHNGVGDLLPRRVLQELPEAVMARLNECYPMAFEKIERMSSGSADELVIEGTITDYREGSRFARAMLIGLGSARLTSEVSFVDGQSGRQLTQAKVDLLWAMGGLVGASQGIEDLIDKGGKQIADAIGERRGLVKKVMRVARPLERQSDGPQQETLAGRCRE